MLVPAMAFAWWLVSMPAPGSAARSEHSQGAPAAESAIETGPQDREVPSGPGDPAAAADETDDETGGERVPLKLVTPQIVRVARTFLDLAMGAERAVNIGGHRYVFVLERHYHPPGFVGGPNGWHKGVTVYEVR